MKEADTNVKSLVSLVSKSVELVESCSAFLWRMGGGSPSKSSR